MECVRLCVCSREMIRRIIEQTLKDMGICEEKQSALPKLEMFVNVLSRYFLRFLGHFNIFQSGHKCTFRHTKPGNGHRSNGIYCSIIIVHIERTRQRLTNGKKECLINAIDTITCDFSFKCVPTHTHTRAARAQWLYLRRLSFSDYSFVV